MRKIAEELDVVPMALYRHVANKDELLDAMVDAVVAEIDPPETDLDWKTAMRRRISARRMLQRHPWAARVIESRRPHARGDRLRRRDDRALPFRVASRSSSRTALRDGEPAVRIHPGAVR